MRKNKKILLYPIKKERHSLHNEDINLIDKNYTLIYTPEKTRGNLNWSFKLLKFYPLRIFYHKFIRKFFTFSDLKNLRNKEQTKKLPCDLIYSVAKIPPFENNYIIDFEKVVSLADHAYDRIDKNFLEKKFAEKNCKAILPWYDIAKRSLIETIDCRKFKDKIHVIPFGMKSDKIKKNYNKKEISILFVSSINNPYDFELKGGIIALEVYSKLIKKYPHLLFKIRAHVPKWVEKKYGNLKGLEFIKEFLSWEEMKKLFLDSDILLEPGVGTNLMLDCMNFALPIVAFDRWEIPEMVIDGKNGFIVDSSLIYGEKKTKEQFQDYLKNYHIRHFNTYKKKFPDKVINDFVESTSKLIENKKLRVKFSKFAKSLVEKGGKYNLEKRNKKLLELFDKSFD